MITRSSIPIQPGDWAAELRHAYTDPLALLENASEKPD